VTGRALLSVLAVVVAVETEELLGFVEEAHGRAWWGKGDLVARLAALS
jgi:hypothetical protein